MREDISSQNPFPSASTEVRQGKVRNIYGFQQKILKDLDPDRLILEATDRISAFDMILPTKIPGRGRILTAMSAFWFERTNKVVPNHFIRIIDEEWLSNGATETARKQNMPIEKLQALKDRAMIVHKAERLPVECIVRGYMAGSAWAEYQEQRTVCGVRLPAGIQESEQFPEPLFTPTTKAEEGHDENLSTEEFVESVDNLEVANALRLRSLALYRYGAAHARERGIIIADTKFEFGIFKGEPIVIDEILTPDSSRFWDATSYEPGRHQEALDKQYVRDWLLESGWDREPPPPELPDDVVAETSRRYHEIYRRLTGPTIPS